MCVYILTKTVSIKDTPVEVIKKKNVAAFYTEAAAIAAMNFCVDCLHESDIGTITWGIEEMKIGEIKIRLDDIPNHYKLDEEETVS